jgi:tetratricopeptide (TPR) repeat protein
VSISPSAVRHEIEAIHLFRLIQANRDETEEGDELRDTMLVSWEEMTDQERELLRGLHRDLHMLSGDEVLDEETATMDQFRVAWKAKDYALVLQLLRKRREPQLTNDKVAYVRGRAWGGLGYREAALAFTTYAADVSPDNGTYAYLALVDAMELDHVDKALTRAAAIEAREDAPIRSFIAAAHALLRFAPDDGAARLYERAAALLMRAIGAESARLPTEQLPGLLAQAYVELGMCREMLRDAAGALESYSDALKVDPKNDAALTARGLLLMNTDERAAERDFERAVQSRTPLVWPYLYLAPMYLRREEYMACIQVCSAALKHALDQGDEQRANFYEWLAIANRARRAPEPIVEDLFALAGERAPLNLRIDENRRRQRDWEVVRDTSLDESTQRFREAFRRQPPLPAAA